jgi:hypothetical protein
MASLNLRKIIFEHLKSRPEERLTARQIAQWVFETYPKECEEKRQRSKSLNSNDELLQQLVAEIGANRPEIQKKHPELKITEGRPRKYYYSDKSDSTEVEVAEHGDNDKQSDITVTEIIEQPASKNDGKQKLNEHALYPLLSQFLLPEFGVNSKRIDEKRSSNKYGSNGNKWLHPDIVGMEILGAEWDSEVTNCVNQYADKRTRLWSFEVKMLINRSNVRECFFQAVSNSSWANFGYLVTKDIDSSALKELRLLSSAHGIGLIQLEVDNPTESQVLIPARERDEIDWDMVNRLATENKDFMEFIKLVRQFYQTGDLRPKDWDAQQT